MDIIKEAFPEAQAQVEKRLFEVMAAAEAQDVELLESYHLWGPKFSKFDDWEPLERQDAETTKRLEHERMRSAW
ncbi:hypothetical protein BH24DEI1_BH24DEI1_13850 [soil metagenome]